MSTDPAVLCQLQELVFAQTAGGLVVDRLEGGDPVLELGHPQPPGEFAVFPVEPFVIDEEPDELGLAEALVILALDSLLQRLGEGEELHGVELVEGLFEQHNSDPCVG